MRVLGLETSCDETSAAVVRDGSDVMSNVIASQVDIHARYGGIVPEVASRQHMLQMIPIVEQALSDARGDWDDIDAVAVTAGPGLAGALLVGVSAAKAIAFARGVPLIGVNHLEAHIYATWARSAGEPSRTPDFPLIGLIASGGHTELVLMRGHGDYEMLGRTRDDAAGEAFDKAARVLGLGFPGGPAIQRVAEQAREPVNLPRAWLKGTHDFSFSGLKTAVLHMAEGMGLYPREEGPDDDGRTEAVANVAAGFQEAVVDVLVEKTVRAANESDARSVILAGGVAANGPLRQRLLERSPVPVGIPPLIMCTDNAAMIAACGYQRLQRGLRSGMDLDVRPSWRLGDP